MNVDNVKSQMRKGMLEYCILLLLHKEPLYASDIILKLKEARLIVVEGTLYPLLTRLTMKKTLTVNLGGTVYHIDEDAYKLLDTYLSNLRIHFCREEGAEEIVHDMELRISELFTDRLRDGKQVITIEDVEEIIAQMGKP